MLEVASSEIETAKTEWSDAVREQRDEHNEVLRKLEKEGLEPNKYLDATRALETLKLKELRRVGIAKSLQSLQTKRDTPLQELRRPRERQGTRAGRGDSCRERRDRRSRDRETGPHVGSEAHQVVDRAAHLQPPQSHHGCYRPGELLNARLRAGGAIRKVGTERTVLDHRRAGASSA